jgi:hypothetical protein
MPTVAEIERLRALLERLQPMSARQRGEVIASDDWNRLVGAVIEIGRATLTDDAAGKVAPHDHPDQVAVGWLDPKLRQLVTGGGVRDPALETELGKLRRDLGQLVTRIDRVGGDVDRSRVRIDEVATNDLVREATLERLNRKVLGAADDRGDIADLRATLRTLQTEVGRAVQVGTRLEIDGQPIDVPALVGRVTEVERLRERLTRPDGSLLDASALELRLLDLQSGLVSQADLTEAIADVRTEIDAGGLDLDRVLDAARVESRTAAGTAVETLRTQLQAELADRFRGIDQAVTAAVDRVSGALSERLLSSARAEIDGAVGRVDQAIRSSLGQLIETRIGAVTADFEARLSTLPELVRGQVSSALDTQLSSALRNVEGRFAGLDTQVAQLARESLDNQAAIQDTRTRFETARRQDTAARAELRAELLERISVLDANVGPRIVSAVDDARTILRTDLNASVTALRRDLSARFEEVARKTAATEVQVLGTRIRSDVQSIVKQEIDANLSNVRNTISGEIAGFQRMVSGLVTNEVARATANIPTLVSAEFETFRPEVTRIIDSRVVRTPMR